VSPVAGATWPDGRGVNVATDSDGNIDWKGVLFSNPVLVEQGFKVVDGVKDFLGKITLPNGNQVVNKTPKGAVDGTPRQGAPAAAPAPGVGEPPRSPNRPDPPPPPPRRGGFPEG
jgi:hypothetical protein